MRSAQTTQYSSCAVLSTGVQRTANSIQRPLPGQCPRAAAWGAPSGVNGRSGRLGEATPSRSWAFRMHSTAANYT